jgi:hypothetical protein
MILHRMEVITEIERPLTFSPFDPVGFRGVGLALLQPRQETDSETVASQLDSSDADCLRNRGRGSTKGLVRGLFFRETVNA